jgi:hypothetical protein
LKDCNAFIKGRYLEVGVNHNGAYGSSTPPPSGYHPRGATKINNAAACAAASGAGLGFVVDPAKDGWADSTFPARAYYGDFFMPGHPQEGWSIMTDTQANCWNGNLKEPMGKGITGANTSYVVAGSRVATVWKGTYDSIAITQRTVLDTNNTFFTMRITLKNLSAKPKKNVYYLRTVDPDNEVTHTWNFVTLNRIDQQLPNPKNRTVISAEGPTYKDAYVALATKDVRAKAFINKKSLQPEFNKLDSMYAADTANYMYKEKDTLRSDVCISTVFKIDSLPAAGSTVIVLSYMFRPADIDSALEDDGSMPGDEAPSLVSNFENEANIQIVPNPFSSTLQLRGMTEGDRIYVYDMYGKRSSIRWESDNAGNARAQTTELQKGVYIIRIESADGQLKHTQQILHD